MSYADDIEDYDQYKRSIGEPTARQLREWRSSGPPAGSFGHQEFLDAAPQSPEAKEAFRVILSAGKRSRFRVLAIVCPRNHTIAEIYRAPAGLILVGRGPLTSSEARAAGGVVDSHYHPEYGHVGDTEWSSTWYETRRTNREERVTCFVDDLRREGRAWQIATMQCRCMTAEFGAEDIERYLATGKPRVVHTKEAQRK